MLRETTIRTTIECINFKPGKENSIYPIESRKEEKDKWVKKDFQCGFPIKIHCVVMGDSGWSEMGLRHSTQLRI